LVSYPALEFRYSLGPGSALLQDLLHAALDEFHPLAITQHETADGWRVFFREHAHRDAALSALADQFGPRLTALSGIEVPDEDWARRSQEQLTAIRVERIIVAPPWDVPGGALDRDVVIVIDPSMGFGTGHHETTRLCLRLLQQLDVQGRRVIDVGTGSGVLAIAAWKLGAQSVVAVDSDPDALFNARENIERNGAAGRIDVRETDLGTLRIPPADVVLANLTGAVLQRHAAGLVGLVSAPGALIVSGFGPDEARDVADALRAPPGSALVEGSWAALLLRKGSSA
jgi:ribosomal protein L11 methyltransferase